MSITIKNDKKAMANIRKLKYCREAKGLNQTELSKKTKVPRSSLFDYEHGRHIPSFENYNKLAHFFNWKKITIVNKENKSKSKNKVKVKNIEKLSKPKPKPTPIEWPQKWMEAEEEEKLKNQERLDSLSFSFDINEIYYIDDYYFQYIGKEGIHHCFKEVNSGWSRTYTDYQLIGKNIRK